MEEFNSGVKGLNTPTLQGGQPCFSIQVKAILLNTSPAAGHNPAGTSPRLLEKPKLLPLLGYRTNQNKNHCYDKRRNHTLRKQGPISTLLLRYMENTTTVPKREMQVSFLAACCLKATSNLVWLFCHLLKITCVILYPSISFPLTVECLKFYCCNIFLRLMFTTLQRNQTGMKSKHVI